MQAILREHCTESDLDSRRVFKRAAKLHDEVQN